MLYLFHSSMNYSYEIGPIVVFNNLLIKERTCCGTHEEDLRFGKVFIIHENSHLFPVN